MKDGRFLPFGGLMEDWINGCAQRRSHLQQGERGVKLRHAAFRHDEDAVRIDDRIEAVRNCENGAVGKDLAHRLLNESVGL